MTPLTVTWRLNLPCTRSKTSQGTADVCVGGDERKGQKNKDRWSKKERKERNGGIDLRNGTRGTEVQSERTEVNKEIEKGGERMQRKIWKPIHHGTPKCGQHVPASPPH